MPVIQWFIYPGRIMSIRLDKMYFQLEKINLLLKWFDEGFLSPDDLSYALKQYTNFSLTRINHEWEEYPDSYDLFMMLIIDLEICRGVRLAEHIALTGNPKHPSIFW